MAKVREYWTRFVAWAKRWKAAIIGGLLLVAFAFGLARRKTPVVVGPNEPGRLEAERDRGAAEALDAQADAMAPAAEREQGAIEASKARVEDITDLPATATDEEVAASFADAGLGRRRVP